MKKIKIIKENIQYRASYLQLANEALTRFRALSAPMTEKEMLEILDKNGWTINEIDHISKLIRRYIGINKKLNEHLNTMTDVESTLFIAKKISYRFKYMTSIYCKEN